MILEEIGRLYVIVRVLLNYGLDELIPRVRLTLPLRLGRKLLFWLPNKHAEQPLGERLRLAMEELGPVWIKFGQMLSRTNWRCCRIGSSLLTAR